MKRVIILSLALAVAGATRPARALECGAQRTGPDCNDPAVYQGFTPSMAPGPIASLGFDGKFKEYDEYRKSPGLICSIPYIFNGEAIKCNGGLTPHGEYIRKLSACPHLMDLHWDNALASGNFTAISSGVNPEVNKYPHTMYRNKHTNYKALHRVLNAIAYFRDYYDGYDDPSRAGDDNLGFEGLNHKRGCWSNAVQNMLGGAEIDAGGNSDWNRCELTILPQGVLDWDFETTGYNPNAAFATPKPEYTFHLGTAFHFINTVSENFGSLGINLGALWTLPKAQNLVTLLLTDPTFIQAKPNTYFPGFRRWDSNSPWPSGGLWQAVEIVDGRPSVHASWDALAIINRLYRIHGEKLFGTDSNFPPYGAAPPPAAPTNPNGCVNGWRSLSLAARGESGRAFYHFEYNLDLDGKRNNYAYRPSFRTPPLTMFSSPPPAKAPFFWCVADDRAGEDEEGSAGCSDTSHMRGQTLDEIDRWATKAMNEFIDSTPKRNPSGVYVNFNAGVLALKGYLQEVNTYQNPASYSYCDFPGDDMADFARGGCADPLNANSPHPNDWDQWFRVPGKCN